MRQIYMSYAEAACPTSHKQSAEQKAVPHEARIPPEECHLQEISVRYQWQPSQTSCPRSCPYPPLQSPHSPVAPSNVQATPEEDNSQTFPKQLTDPWTTLGEAESQSPEHLKGPVWKRKVPNNALAAEQQDFAIVSETAKIPQRLTRSRTKSRQQHLDECFPRLRADPKRTESYEHSPST